MALVAVELRVLMTDRYQVDAGCVPDTAIQYLKTARLADGSSHAI
jgi:hypothetical protein